MTTTHIFYATTIMGALCLAATACGGGSSTGTGGAGGDGGTSSTGGGEAGAGGTGTGTGTGSMMTFHPGVLVDRGVVVRYYLDEAADGQTPTAALDATTDPLDLPITYVNDVDGMHLLYTEDAGGNRGLFFDAASRDDRASAPIDTTKVRTMVEGGTEVTYELVAALEDVDFSGSRLLHIGLDTDHTLSLETSSLTRIAASVNDTDAGKASVYHPDLGRGVFHMVVDVTQTAPEDRARLYVNGAHLPNVQNVFVAQGVPITIGDMRHLVIGNREVGGRSPQGTIFYAAIYNVALDDAEVVQNAALLLLDDDTPATPAN